MTYKWFHKSLFGDDVFISYSRADGTAYAAALANKLADRRLSCRFDQWGTEPGRDVPKSILEALRRSRMLVIVATDAAYQSAPVEQEIRQFLPTAGLIVPIDLGGRIMSARWWPLIEGLPISKDPSSPPNAPTPNTPDSRSTSGSETQGASAAKVVIVPETARDPQATGPSPEVLSRIENSIDFTKKDARLRRAAFWTSLLLVLFIGAAAGAALFAASRQKLASAADRNRAAAELRLTGSIKETKAQTDLAKQANARRVDAETKTTTAQAALIVAQQQTAQAVVQQQQAERLKRRADLLTDARTTLDAREPLAALAPIAQGLRISDGPDARLLFAEAYNLGVARPVAPLLSYVRQFRIDPIRGDRILAVGASSTGLANKMQLALANLTTGETKTTAEYWFLAATFSPDGRRIYAAAITKDDRGPNEGMDTKIDREVSLLCYDEALRLERKLPLGTIRTRSEQLGERPEESWDIRDVQDMSFDRSGTRILLAGYASDEIYRNVGNAFPHHWRAWLTLPDYAVHHSVDVDHELSAYNPYRGRVLPLDDTHLVLDGIAEVYLLDLRGGGRTLIGRHTSAVGDLAVSPSGTTIAAVGSDNRVTLFRRGGDAWQPTVETLQGSSSCDRVAFVSNDEIAVARGDGIVTLLQIGESIDDESLHVEYSLAWRSPRERQFSGHGARINSMEVSRDGRWIATASEDKTVRLWSPYEHATRTIYGSKRGVTDLHFSADSARLVMSDADGALRIFAPEDSHTFTLPIEPGSRRRENLVSDSAWDEGGGLERVILREHLGFVQRMALRADGHLVAWTYDRRRTEWDADYHVVRTEQSPPRTFADTQEEDKNDPRATARRLAEELQRRTDADWQAAREVNSSRQWGDSPDGRQLRLHPLSLPADSKATTVGVFSPDDRWFLQFEHDAGRLHVWDTRSPERPAASFDLLNGRLSGGRDQEDGSLGVRFSPRGTYVAFPMYFGGTAIAIIDLRTLRPRVFHADIVASAFDIADSGTLVAAGRTGGVFVYDSVADETVSYEKHGRYVSSVAMSPDGRWAASGSRDRSVRLWSIDSGRYLELKVLNPVEQVLFTRRGTELLAAAGRAIHSWYVPVGDAPLTWIHEGGDRDASHAAMPAAGERQADNLSLVRHEHGPRPSAAAIEAALGRSVPRTDPYKRQLLALLGSSDQPPHARIRAAFELSCFGPLLANDVLEISRRLDSETPADDEVFRAVVVLLGAIGPSVESVLRTELQRAVTPARVIGLAYATAALFPKSSVLRAYLHASLTDPNENIRVNAALMLNDTGLDAATIPVLAGAIGAGHPRRSAAAATLSRHGSAAVPSLIGILATANKRLSYDDPHTVARRALVAIGAPAAPLLVKALRTADEDSLRQIVTALGEIGPPAQDALSPLIELASTGGAENSMSAIMQALALIGPADERVASFLIGRLSAPRDKGADPLSAVYSIGRMSPAVAVPRLRPLLAEGPGQANEYVLNALGRFGAAAGEAMPELMTLLQPRGTGNEPSVSDRLAKTLGEIGPPAHAAVPTLVSALTSGQDHTPILQALGKIGARPDLVIPAIVAVIRQEAGAGRVRKFEITAAALRTMTATGVEADIVRSLERFDDSLAREEGLFSSLVQRTIGDAKWHMFGARILSAAYNVIASSCADQGTVRDAFEAIGEFGAGARPFLPQILELRFLVAQCGGTVAVLDRTVKRIEHP